MNDNKTSLDLSTIKKNSIIKEATIKKYNHIYFNLKNGIKNLPDPLALKRKANRILINQISNIFDLLMGDYNESNLTDNYSLNLISDVHHATELFLKSEICKTNPLFLIEEHLLNSISSDFSEISTISANTLIDKLKYFHDIDNTFFKNSFDIKFIEMYDKNRILRNKHNHSFLNEYNLNNNELIKILINSFAILEIFNKNTSLLKTLYKQSYLNCINKFKKLHSYKYSYEYSFEYNIEYNPASDIARADFMSKFTNAIWNNVDFKYINKIFLFKRKLKKSDLRINCPNCNAFFKNSRYNNIQDIDKIFKTFYPIKKNEHKFHCCLCGYEKNINSVLAPYIKAMKETKRQNEIERLNNMDSQ